MPNKVLEDQKWFHFIWGFMEDFEKELKVCFLDEAQQSASAVESCFLDLEKSDNNDTNLNQIFRHVHNLKGSSKAVGFDNFAEFTHHFESFILKVKNKELPVNPAVVNLLLLGNDQLVKMISELKVDINARFEFADILQKLQNFNLEASQAVEPLIDVAPQSNDTETNIEQEHSNSVSAASEQTKEVPVAAPTVAAKKPAVANRANSDESIRVSISKIDSLLNTIGELVILQGVLRETVQDSPNDLLRKTVHQIRKVGKEIQDTAMSLRMVSVKPTFQKMQRIVRDTSQALSKEIEFEIRGEDSEVDKTVLEKINDPLVHLIRNAVDHGIESGEIRKKSGKSEKGKIILSAYNQSGKFIIDIVDDGGGINPEKLKAKAIEKGIIKADAKLTEKEALHLVFAPGFSTKEKVTDVSGRGVGMDVVKTNISELSGEILIDSKVGFGTTFKVVLPLTLSIIEAMILTYS